MLKPCVTPSRVLARSKKWRSQVRVCEKMAKYASIGPLIYRKMLKISHFLSFQKKWEKQRQKIKIRFLNIFRPKKGMRERSFFVWKIAKNQPWEHSTSTALLKKQNDFINFGNEGNESSLPILKCLKNTKQGL